MNFAHAHISDSTAFFSHAYVLWWWITVHYGWLAHSFANRKHLALWRHLSELRSVLAWVMNHWPSTGTISQLG